MGIPFFFAQIIKQYPNILLNNNLSKCNRLFIDFNACIHNVSAQVISNNPKDYTNLDIFNEVIKYTLKIVNICKPSDLLYLGVDGVANFAKIQQQRRRRYLSAYRNTLINDFKKKNGLAFSNWDSNAITPGTSFMIELDSFLNNYFKENKFPFKVILSGHNQKGEGEHKIIKYIKDNSSSSNENFTDIILGLDADLIMLALGCNKSNIYLMREYDDDKNQKNVTKQFVFKYLNIDKLRISISQYLYKNDDILYMYDYIFICMFCGNDFLPSLSFLKLKNGALDILCDIYKQVFEKLQEHLVQNINGKYIINHEFLVKMLDLFSKIEDNCMKDAIEQHKNIIFNPNKKFNTKIEKFIYEYENFPLINKFPDVINPNIDSNWRLNYYHYLFGSHTTDIMKNSTMNYIEGLLWTANYYFNNSCDNLWYYEYNYSPCVSDLYKYTCNIDKNNFQKMQLNLLFTNKINKEIDSDLQMLLVLPPQSIDIVPEKYRKLFTDINYGCVHLFPKKFKLSTFLKTQTWECIPLLPRINLKYISEKVA